MAKSQKLLVSLLLASSAGLCVAQEMGRVISSTPMIQQIAVPRQVCSNQQVTTSGNKSGAGAAMGAIAGGAIGNAVGDGGGRAIATVIGLMGGAILGDRVEGPGQPQTQNIQTCTNQMFYENRTVGYNVVYEYAGKQYTVQMPNDPGPYVKLQVTPISAATPTNPGMEIGTQIVAAQPPIVASPQWVNPPVIVVSQDYYPRTVYSAFPQSYVYPSVGFNLQWSNGGRRRHHD